MKGYYSKSEGKIYRADSAYTVSVGSGVDGSWHRNWHLKSDMTPVHLFTPWDPATWPEDGDAEAFVRMSNGDIKPMTLEFRKGSWFYKTPPFATTAHGTVTVVAWRPIEQESQKIQASVEVLAEPREVKTLYADTLDDLLEEIRSFVDGRKTGEIIIT